ncbi:Acg family FMN-binding oxidoreductase [Actinoplanes sp. CA-051413]|uniref:Acg family FMN-binding oxidoreductase n=1 Tax=Actinoplanes sp. CA-051413 TaxID=3239899 RepID=UPI003D992D27
MTAQSGPPTRSRPAAALEAAAHVAGHAPSVFNTQPWRWQLSGDTLELHADRTRALTATDPDSRLLLLSCGAALHHARVALRAAGWDVHVERLPQGDAADVLARITIAGAADADRQAERMAGAITLRRTDRRAFSDRTVPEELLIGLRRAVEAEGAYLHVVRRDQMPMLATSTARAADAESSDPAYRAELEHWTNRPVDSGDGVPAATAVQRAPRRVPVRDYAPGAVAGLSPGDDFDLGASYVVLFGLTDEAEALLRGGEALSALLLAATADGLATAPMSDTIEVQWPRHLLKGLLSGVGEPYLTIRLGYNDAAPDLPPAPRRKAADIVRISDR